MRQTSLLSCLTACVALVLIQACSATKTTGSDDGRISINLVQVNDVYEIAPLNNGREGGLARIATLKKKYLAENPNTLLLMAGDFLSPSVYNSLRYQSAPVRGKQMVACMNAAGFDLAVFGNHEFDIREAELQQRIDESAFTWISSNTFHKRNGQVKPFEKTTLAGREPFPAYQIRSFRDQDGTEARVAFIGLTLPFNRAAHVSYTDVRTTAAEWYNKLKDSADAVVAITHQAMEDDVQLARDLPGLAAILGGHEHDQRFAKIGGVTITKAMANAKTAYVVKLTVNKKKRSCRVGTSLETLSENMALDSATNAVVSEWTNIAAQSFTQLGFDINAFVLEKGDPLEGRETEVRSRETNLTRLVVSAMGAACPDARLAILNGGSIRVDDILTIPVSQYDILRTLPFGGSIKECTVNGAVLVKIFEAGRKNLGTGGFLHYSQPVSFDEARNRWTIAGADISPGSNYRLAIPEFLLTGGESNLGFLKQGSPDLVAVHEEQLPPGDPRHDIRKAVIRFLTTGGR